MNPQGPLRPRRTFPLTRAERDRLLAAHRQEGTGLEEALMETPEIPDEEIAQFQARQQAICDEYFERLPRIKLSRCPICDKVLVYPFDAWGLEGFWWQEDLSKDLEPAESCSHFRLLLGAVNLNGQRPKGGEAEAHVGAEVPFVVPRILEMPTMIAVVTSVPMANGYTAYPIAYFSKAPPPLGSLTAPWTRTTYGFTDADGEPGWMVRNDAWDFDVQKWVTRGKVKWIEPGDDQFAISRRRACPYANVKGRQEQLIITGNELDTEPPPDPDDLVDPFTD